MAYCNIRDVCIQDVGKCLPATPEEAKRLAEYLVSSPNLLTKRKPNSSFRNCGGKSIKKTLIPKTKKVKSSAPTITFVNEDSYHLSFYDCQCNVCFCNREIQEYRIYLKNMYEDTRKAVVDDPMSSTFVSY